MLNFDYKKRLTLDELNQKIEKIDNNENYENNEYNLKYMINQKIKNKE